MTLKPFFIFHFDFIQIVVLGGGFLDGETKQLRRGIVYAW